MKKLILIGVILGLLVSIAPSLVVAKCLPECCCYMGTRYYNVSYFDEAHNWTTERVEAWTAREAAEDLGLRAGYDCFVGYDGMELEPRTFWYKVSFFDEGHNWVSEYVEAENREDAVNMVNPDGGYFVSRAVNYEP